MGKRALLKDLKADSKHLNLGKLFCRGAGGKGSQLVNWLAACLHGPLAAGHVVREHRHLAIWCKTVVIRYVRVCECIYV